MRRIDRPDHARFITFSCYGRLPLFANDRIKDAFVGELERWRERRGVWLYAWVVMPEHVHLLLRSEAPLAGVLQSLKGWHSRRVLARWRELEAPVLERVTDTRGRARFWQRGGGYDRNLWMGEELMEKVGYIHANPVRRGLVGRAEDWAWSSARW